MSRHTEKLFDDIAQFISESRTLLEEGALMELAGLDDQVRTLCESVLQLSQDERIMYADKLQYLLGELKALGEELVTQRDHVAGELRATSSHKKASVAYQTADSRDAFGKRDDDKDE